MRSVMVYRAAKFILLASTSILCACEGQGFSGLQAEWSRTRGPETSFAVISASHERAVVSAKGRQVAIVPADGFCLAEESIETSGRSAFLLIGDCALDAVKSGSTGARGELQLPRGIPGFITVSVSGSSGVPVDGSKDRTLSNLGAFFETPEGRRLLGRGGDGRKVSVVESRRTEDGLFVLVDDRDRQPVPLLSSRFWRSFVQLNDRLAVVTMSGFRDRPLSEDDMLEHLIAQVKQLHSVNRTPINERPTVIARRSDRTSDQPSITLRAPPGEDDAAAQKISDLKPTAIIVTTSRPDDANSKAETVGKTDVATNSEASDGTEPTLAEEPKITLKPGAEANVAAVGGALPGDGDVGSSAAGAVAASPAPATPRQPKVASQPETALTPSLRPRPKPKTSVTVVLDPSVEKVKSISAPERAPSAPPRPKRG